MPRRVLIVEAGFELGPLVSEGLARIDPEIEIDRAESMNVAVDRLAAAGYDLIVCDDEIDGARSGLLLRHLCERRFPAIPFVLLASGAVDGEPDPTLLCKPFSPSELGERIARLLA